MRDSVQVVAGASPMSSAETRRDAVISAFFLGALGTGGFTLLPVTLPALASAFGLSAGQVGFVGTLQLVGVTCGAVAAGLIARRLRTRPMAVAGTIISLACTLATMFVRDISVLAALRFADGAMVGITTSLAYAALSTTARPDRNFALLSVFPLLYGTVGFALIPGFENSVGWHAPFIFLSVTDTVSLAAAFWLVVSLRRGASPLSFIGSLPNLRGNLTLASIVFYYAGVCAIYAFSFDIGTQMTGSQDISGTILSVSQFIGIAGCLLAVFLAGRIARRKAIVFGFLVTLAGAILLVQWGGTASFLIGLLAIDFAWNFLAGFHIAAASTMDDRGSAAAFIAVAINGGAALGPLLGFTVSGANYVGLEVTSIALVVVAMVLILAALKEPAPNSRIQL